MNTRFSEWQEAGLRVKEGSRVMTMNEEAEQIIATALAAAYWRGRFDAIDIQRSKIGDVTFEAMIKAGAQADRDKWVFKANECLRGLEVARFADR